MATSVSRMRSETLRTLPDDNVRQILWRFADRYDLQMLVPVLGNLLTRPCEVRHILRSASNDTKGIGLHKEKSHVLCGARAID